MMPFSISESASARGLPLSPNRKFSMTKAFTASLIVSVMSVPLMRCQAAFELWLSAPVKVLSQSWCRQDADEGRIVAEAGGRTGAAFLVQLGDRLRVEETARADLGLAERRLDIVDGAGADEGGAVGCAIGAACCVCRSRAAAGPWSSPQDVFLDEALQLHLGGATPAANSTRADDRGRETPSMPWPTPSGRPGWRG